MIIVTICFIIFMSIFYLFLGLSIRENLKKIKQDEEETYKNLKWLKDHKLKV